MTIASSSNKVIIAGNNATSVFNFSFPYVASGDIQVYYTDASGNLSLIPSNQYTLALNAPSGGIWGLGGSVTYLPGGIPIASGTSLTILRTLPELQATSISNQGASYPQVIETALDYLTMVTQQLQEQINRSILIPVSSTGSPPTFGTPAANAVVVYDATGTILLASTSAFVTATGINNTVIGATSPANGTFTNLTSANETVTGTSSINTLAGSCVGGQVFRQRTFTGTANAIDVTNGSGAGGNPTFNLSTALTFTGKTITGGSYTGVSFMGIGVAPSYILDVLLAETRFDNQPSYAGQIKNSLGNVAVSTASALNLKLSLDNAGASVSSMIGVNLLIDLSTNAGPNNLYGFNSTITASGGTFPSFNNDHFSNFRSIITIPDFMSPGGNGVGFHHEMAFGNNNNTSGMSAIYLKAPTTGNNVSILNYNGVFVGSPITAGTNSSFTNIAGIQIGGPGTLDATSSAVNIYGLQISDFTTGTFGNNSANLFPISYAFGVMYMDHKGYIKHGGMAVVATQFDKAANTTLGNITNLSVPLLPGKKYKFKAVLHVTADGTGGHKYAMGGTTDVLAMIYEVRSLRNDTQASVITARETALATGDGAAGGTSIFTVIEGYIQTNTVGGTFTAQFAQNAASGTSSVLVGSYLEVEKAT